MIQIIEIYNIVTGLLANNSRINDFCVSKYAQGLNVYLGINLKDPPSHENAPFCAIYGETRNSGNGEYSYTLDIATYIAQSAIDTTSNVIELRGMKEVEELRQIVENVLLAAKTGLGKIETDGETDMECIYPLFRADTLIKITYPLSRR